MTDIKMPMGRYFMTAEGVLFIAVEDLLNDYRALQKDNLNPPIEVIIAGLESSQILAQNQYNQLKVKQKNEPSKPQS